MKKRFNGNFKKIIAIVLAMILLVTTGSVTLNLYAAEEITTYNGEEFKITGTAANFGTTINGYKSDDFVTGLNSYVVPINHPAGYSPKVEKSQYFYVQSGVLETLTEEQSISVPTDGALMFYVKMPSSQPETKFNMQFNSASINEDGNTRSWHVDNDGIVKDYYLLPNGALEWQSLETVQIGEVADDLSAKSGAIVLPSGFNGWVRVPVDNFTNSDKLAAQRIYRMDFYFDRMTTDTLYLGAFMSVDNGTANLTTLSVGDVVYNLIEHAAYTATALGNTEFSGNDFYSLNSNGTSKAQTVGLFNKGNSFDLSVSNENTEQTLYTKEFYNASFIPYLYIGGATTGGNKDWTVWANRPQFSNNFAPTADTYNAAMIVANPDSTDSSVVNGVYTAPEETYPAENYSYNIELYKSSSWDYVESFVWNTENSLIFYVENSGTVSNKLSFTMAKGSPNIHLVKDKDYYILNNNSAEWVRGTTVTAINADRGYIELPAGFKGWVRIPCDSFYDGNGKISNSNVNYQKIRVFPKNLGGDYGAIAIGEFGIVDNVDSLYFINSDYTDSKPVSMIKAPYNANIPTNLTNTPVRPSGQTAFTISASEENSDKFATRKLTFTAGTNHTAANDSKYLDTATGIYSNSDLFNSDYRVDFNFDSIKWTTTGALMFYVKSTGTKDSQMWLMNSNKWVYLSKDTDYYSLRKDSTQWETCKTVVFSGDMANFVIPAGFEGWIRVPTSSMANDGKNADEHDFSKLQLFPSLLGGEYGEITVSHLMFVDRADDTCCINLGDKIITTDGEEVSKELFEDISEYNVTVSDGKITSTADATALSVKADVEDKVLSDDQGIMFYAKTEQGAKLTLALSNTNSTNEGFAYSYVDNTYIWNDAVSADGSIELPAGFEGWVKLSANAFAKRNIDSISVGFADATECSVSDFMIINQAEHNLDYIIINGKKITLFVELYDANADGTIDVRDLVGMKNYLAKSGALVPEIAADIDGKDGINATDLTLVIKRLINGPEQKVSEFAISRYISENEINSVADTATLEKKNS